MFNKKESLINTYRIYGYKCTMIWVSNIGFENIMTSDTIELDKLKLRKYNATYGQSCI